VSTLGEWSWLTAAEREDGVPRELRLSLSMDARWEGRAYAIPLQFSRPEGVTCGAIVVHCVATGERDDWLRSLPRPRGSQELPVGKNESGATLSEGVSGRKPWWRARQFWVVATTLLCAALIAFLMIPPILRQQPFMVIPDVVNTSEDKALAALAAMGFDGKVIASELDHSTPAGRVIRQAPRFGTRVVRGSQVELIVSAGIGVAVPDLTKRKQQDAFKVLRTVSLVGTVAKQESDPTIPPGYVIRSTPGPGERVAKDTVIQLTVSSGPGDGQAPGVPRVISVLGKEAREAKRVLTAAGLTMVVGGKSLHDHVPAGHVVWQNPRPGEHPLPGNMVRVQLSLGRGVEVPPLALVSASQAEQRLRRIGLRPRVTRRWANTRKDTVISSYPGEGKIVATGSVVQLVVSKGRQQGGTAYGLLSVSAGPSGSQIWLYVDGGNTRGRCPQTIRVTAGTHRIILWDPKHGKQMTFAVRVDAGRTTSISRAFH
jgi:beta-lactam-binding protein with PASTA domain